MRLEDVEVCEWKSSGFGFLASVFLELPDEELVARLRGLGGVRDCDATAEFAAFAKAVEGVSDEAVAEELGVNRARLVRHVDAECIMPPYESLYVQTPESGVLSQLNAFFLERNYVPAKAVKEPADQLGMELGFMAYAYQLQDEALRRGGTRRLAKRPPPMPARSSRSIWGNGPRLTLATWRLLLKPGSTGAWPSC